MGEIELGDVLIEKPRNGIGPQEEVESNGRALLRINAVSSSPMKRLQAGTFAELDALLPSILDRAFSGAL